jgi:hypothetical protein
MTITELTPDAATIAKLLAAYPRLDAGGNHGAPTEAIAKFYAASADRDLAQEIATCRQYYREHSIGHDSVSAYTSKHFVESWLEKTRGAGTSAAMTVTAAAMVCAAALEEREVRVIVDRYYVAINVLLPED